LNIWNGQKAIICGTQDLLGCTMTRTPERSPKNMPLTADRSMARKIKESKPAIEGGKAQEADGDD
jgi:hypothetical protein